MIGLEKSLQRSLPYLQSHFLHYQPYKPKFQENCIR